jgi:SNARE domain
MCDAVPGMDQGKMDAIFSELAEPTPAYTDQQMQQLNSIQNEYEQRDKDIAELIKEVTSIQEVMRDLSVLVVEQGSMVDRIDQNIVAATENIDRGVDQIRRAHESSKSGAMATCIFVLLIAIVIVFVLMIGCRARMHAPLAIPLRIHFCASICAHPTLHNPAQGGGGCRHVCTMQAHPYGTCCT